MPDAKGRYFTRYAMQEQVFRGNAEPGGRPASRIGKHRYPQAIPSSASACLATTDKVEQAARDSFASLSRTGSVTTPRSNNGSRRERSALPSGRTAFSNTAGGENSTASEMTRTARKGIPARAAASATAPLSMSTAQAPAERPSSSLAFAVLRTA